MKIGQYLAKDMDKSIPSMVPITGQ